MTDPTEAQLALSIEALWAELKRQEDTDIPGSADWPVVHVERKLIDGRIDDIALVRAILKAANG